MDQSAWIGLDIGGANLKASDGRTAVSRPFPLWRDPDGLTEAIRKLIAEFPQADGYAATMTGELADCYATKAEGVRAIVNALVTATAGLPLWIATTDDRWLSPEDAVAGPADVAAANWRLLARGAAGVLGLPDALVVDVGSTTTDLTRVEKGKVGATASDDTGRLVSRELLYSGVRRTPLCAVVDAVPYRGSVCPVAAELFATTGDVWLTLGELDEDPRIDTADGRPFDRPSAQGRLARMVCADASAFDEQDARRVATHVATLQSRRLRQALHHICPTTDLPIVVAGEGEFLVRRALEGHAWSGAVVSLAREVGTPASDCGPAWAASQLAPAEITPGVSRV